jgi:hypothetical protein
MSATGNVDKSVEISSAVVALPSQAKTLHGFSLRVKVPSLSSSLALVGFLNFLGKPTT